MKSFLLSFAPLCFAVLTIYAGDADALRARLSDLEKLRTDKLITDSEYQEMRKTALQNFNQPGSTTSGAASAVAPAGAPAAAPAVAPAAASAVLPGITPGLGTPGATAGAAGRSGEAPDLSTPDKTAQALQRAFDAKDHAGVVRLVTGKLKEQISSWTPQVAAKELAPMKILRIREVRGPFTKEGKEQSQVSVTMADGDGEYAENIGMVKEGAEWRITDI